MDITNGIKINNSVLNNNNMFKFVTAIDFNCEDNSLYFPLRITQDNEQELYKRVEHLTNKGGDNIKIVVALYKQILSQLPKATKGDAAWQDGKLEGKSELIIWVKLNIPRSFEKEPMTNDRSFYNWGKNFHYKRFITEEMLNWIINCIYFYDNIGIGNREDDTYYPVDNELFMKMPREFKGILHKTFLYFVKPFGTDRFSSFEFTQSAKKMGRVSTKPIVHTYFPDKINKSGLQINQRAYVDTFRLYVYDTSSSSISSTENYAPPNINLSYLPVINTYNYGAINYFNPTIDYATTLIDLLRDFYKGNTPNIKGDLVTKREVLNNKLKIFNSQELTMRIAGAVSLSGRLQWLSKGYKYQDDNRYSEIRYTIVDAQLNYDNTVYNLSSGRLPILRISNINFDLFKSAMPIQIHTPPTENLNRSLQQNYNSGFPDHYEFAPPIYFRIKNAHTLDVVFDGISSYDVLRPTGLTSTPSHIFFIDVSIIDDMVTNPEYVFKERLPYHIQHIISAS